MLQACLNGTRTRDEHPAVPLRADELAREAAASVAAGADALHLHPRDGDGRETMDPDACDACRRALVEVADPADAPRIAAVLPDGSIAPGNGALVRAAR